MHLKQLDSSKSVRPCDPPIKFIKIAGQALSPILTQLFNHCIKNKIYPSDLKRAVVVPIFKKGRKDQSSNYRPISLISPFSKIFEKCILTQLTNFFNNKKSALKKTI